MACNFKRRFFLSRLWGKVSLLILLAVPLPHHFASAAPLPPAKKVLLLYSWRSVIPANVEWDTGIREVLEGTEGQRIEFYTEYLDLAQFPDEAYLHSLLNLLQTKYSGKKIDLLIPVGDLAFSFLQAHGNALFPGSPIVFCAVVKQQLEALKPPPNSSGVVAWVDVEGTLAAALKLQPRGRRVVVVGGIAKTDRALQQIAREALHPYEGQLEVTYLTDLPMAEVLHRVSSLPPQTVVIYLTMLRDSTSQGFVPREALERVAQGANAPVYGLWENLLGRGIVGGHLMSFTEQGRLAGEMGRRVLNGEKPENIPIVYEGADVYEFDWRQLKRWGLKESDLPPGSLVRFKEPSLWESHKREVIGTGAAFSVLSLLVVGLLINLGRRRIADKKLRQAELKYRIVADFTYDWEYWQNPDGTWRYVSPACERISGHRPEEFLGRPGLLRDIIVSEDRDRWDRHNCNAQKDPGDREIQFRIKRPDGSIRWIEHDCQPVNDDAGEFIGVRASNRDITERRQAEMSEQQHREQLTHVARVATMGELTASLAHEVNQPLNAVMNNAQAALRFLHREQPDLEEVGEALGDIVRDGKRAAEVIQRLRQFLRPGEMHAQAVVINQLIMETAALTRNEFQGSNIRIRFSLTDNLPLVWADRIQIQQVVLNLLMNAKEAMDQAGTNPREILVMTEQEDEETVKVSFRDRGPGLTSENLEKIFEPFYTTKTAGMGLGLAISRSIIASLGGRVWAAPNPDQGITLAFTLPIFKEDQG
jgi:PAS domain S-box-containing protein